jgi:hypothetical protein
MSLVTIMVSPLWRAQIEAGSTEVASMQMRGYKVTYNPYVPAYAPLGRQPMWKRVARALRLMKPAKRQPQVFVLPEEVTL